MLAQKRVAFQKKTALAQNEKSEENFEKNQSSYFSGRATGY